MGQISALFDWRVCRKFPADRSRRGEWQSLQGAVVKNESADDAEHPFKCHLATATGHTCGLTFATWRGLTPHQRRPLGGTHGLRHLASLLTDVCVLCGTTCKAACDHLKRALGQQRCVLDLTHAHISLAPITSYSYPVCCHTFGPATDLQWHLRSRRNTCLCGQLMPSWSLDLLPGPVRGRTGATAADQAAARRRGLSGYVVGARRGRGRRRLNSARAEAQAEEHGEESRPWKQDCTRQKQRLTPSWWGNVFTLQEHEGGWKEVRAAGGSQRPARARPGQPSPPLVYGLPVRAGRVRASAGRRPSSSGCGRGRQSVAGAGRRAPDAGGNGRVGHDVSRGGL